MRPTSAALALCVCAMLVAGALAQKPPAADDPASLREAIKTLKWQDIDPGQTALRERCRALLFMSNALSELGAADATQADLLSDYLDQQHLGEQFAASAPPDPPQLTYSDGVKIAIALLQGPLAQSSWATELATVPDENLKGYEQFYDTNCQRKWAEVSEARQEIRRMSKFLKTAGKLQDFDAWLPGEIERRQRENDAERARRRAENVAKEKAEEQRAADARAAQQQEEDDAARQMEAALQTAQTPPAPPATVVIGGDDGWYSGWYYGVLSNIRRPGPWYRDGAYVGQARARTEARVSNWHAAGGGRRR